MKALRVSLALMVTVLGGLWLFKAVEPAPPRSQSLRQIIDDLQVQREASSFLEGESTHTKIRLGADGQLLYFYDGEWRLTPPPPQDLPLLIRRPVEPPALRFTPFRTR